MSESQSNSKLWCGTTPSPQTIERAKQIKLLLMDVDGVLTDGKSYYLPEPGGGAYESKGFDSHDGLAFHLLKDASIAAGFISGRKSQAVDVRAANMQVQYVRQGNIEKKKTTKKCFNWLVCVIIKWHMSETIFRICPCSKEPA